MVTESPFVNPGIYLLSGSLNFSKPFSFSCMMMIAVMGLDSEPIRYCVAEVLRVFVSRLAVPYDFSKRTLPPLAITTVPEKRSCRWYADKRESALAAIVCALKKAGKRHRKHISFILRVKVFIADRTTELKGRLHEQVNVQVGEVEYFFKKR